MQRKLATHATELSHLRQRLKHPGAQLREQAQRLDDLEQRLLLAQRNLLQRQRANWPCCKAACRPTPLPALQLQQRDQQLRRATGSGHAATAATADQLAHLAQMLDSLSPLATLQRGYAIVTDSQGKVVRKRRCVSRGPGESPAGQRRLGLTVSKSTRS